MDIKPIQTYRKEFSGLDHDRLYFAVFTSMGGPKIDGKKYEFFSDFYNSKEFLVQEVITFFSNNINGTTYHVWYMKRTV